MNTEIEFKNGNLVVTRIYQAAIHDVFEAWIETSKLKQWWGCAECTDVQSEVEPKLGGKYNHHMTIETEQGTHEVPGFATLTEYDPPHLLAYTSNDENDHMSIRVEFTQLESGTKVRLTHSNIPDMKVEGDIELRVIIQGGWSAALDKLTAVVEHSRAA